MLELLLLLVENRDRMLGKDEILARVWDGRIVSDSALSTAIKATRQAIGDDGRRQGMIETRHGHGFRFRAPVEALATAGAPPSLCCPSRSPATTLPMRCSPTGSPRSSQRASRGCAGSR